MKILQVLYYDFFQPTMCLLVLLCLKEIIIYQDAHILELLKCLVYTSE